MAPGASRLTGVLAAAAVAAALSPAAAAARGPVVVQRSVEVAELKTSHKAVWSLGARRARGRMVRPTRPITGTRTVLPVDGHRTTPDGIRWLRVRVPGRPNGRKGWIARRGTTLSRTPWQIVINTRTLRLRVYRRGRLARAFPAAVGKPSTPTPHGRFFVEESVRMPAGAAGGPYALALSARSNVLQEFEGGPGQIAVHGVMNLGGRPGTAISHGCVRVADHNTRWMAARIAPGTPVTIVG
ncbi:MAG TPA: L,D-transpeptidase [Thermoleophilaceae bacterium]|nr:L,D-transpeptidase [Thermoleophilaceae bacterium]